MRVRLQGGWLASESGWLREREESGGKMVGILPPFAVGSGSGLPRLALLSHLC